MEEQQKQAVNESIEEIVNPDDTRGLEPKSVPTTEKEVEPAPALNPDEWFAPDEPAEQHKSKTPLLPKKKLLITGGVILTVLILSGGVLYAMLQQTEKQKETTASDVNLAESSATDDHQASEQAAQQPGTETNSGNTSTADSEEQPSISLAGGGTVSNESSGSPSSPAPTTYSVTYTFNGCYSPQNKTINQGDSIRFVNNDLKKDMWPASDNHPSRTIYPEFDAGKAIAPGFTYTFVFSKKGTWGYHDHLKSSCGGTITVQ